MAVEVGVGYVSVVPEARGFGRLLNQQISGESAQVGTGAGQEAGRGFLGGIGGVLKTGVAAVGAAAGVLFAAGFAKAVEQDKSNAKLGAQLGLTEQESARAGKLAGKVYASGYGESIDQVNQSLKALAQNGVASINAPQKELAGLSKTALNLAEAFDVDVADAARAAGQMMRTGLAENGKQAFDLLTLGFQQGADKGGDFIDTMNEYGTQFRKIGLDGASSIGLISQALQAGARDSDVAADALKEFSIRAIDGSKTTADGYKMLGLNADEMAAKFAKGGASATSVLDLTLDKLRAIPDPVKQSQAAVALFGTQAEDLGQALYSMDPSTAAAGLGKVGGAADKMGKTLHNTATQSLEVFKRQALQGLANVATKYALPAVQKFGTFLNTYVLPPAREIGGELLGVLVPAVKGTADAFMGGVQWVKDYGAWLIPLGIAIGGVAVVAKRLGDRHVGDDRGVHGVPRDHPRGDGGHPRVGGCAGHSQRRHEREPGRSDRRRDPRPGRGGRRRVQQGRLVPRPGQLGVVRDQGRVGSALDERAEARVRGAEGRSAGDRAVGVLAVDDDPVADVLGDRDGREDPRDGPRCDRVRPDHPGRQGAGRGFRVAVVERDQPRLRVDRRRGEALVVGRQAVLLVRDCRSEGYRRRASHGCGRTRSNRSSGGSSPGRPCGGPGSSCTSGTSRAG
ncbi:phage tail tape measure protein [Streptomyces sp. UP1A-1]|nr:phage tail tape measure protein [Streptomyces sp. UP1A-1]